MKAHKNVNTSGLKPPWAKGQSGNPTGRPKKRPITDEYFQMSEEPVPEKLRLRMQKKWGMDLPRGITFSKMNAIARYLHTWEKEGHRSAKELREAMEGKAPQRVEITGPERREITIRILHDRTKPKPL